MVATSKESWAWIFAFDGAPAKLIDLRLRKYYSASVNNRFENDVNAIGKSLYAVCLQCLSMQCLDTFISLGTRTKIWCHSQNFISYNFTIRFDGESVKEAKSTSSIHNNILHLATYRGQPFTTGSWIPDHAKTEIMNLESGDWESGPDYPFSSM